MITLEKRFSFTTCRKQLNELALLSHTYTKHIKPMRVSILIIVIIIVRLKEKKRTL